MSNPIPEPLWSLMLATNDCHPGCGCEQDRFERTPARIASWAASARPGESERALAQARGVAGEAAAGAVSREALAAQTNVRFRDDAAAAEWLNAWARLLAGVMDDGPEATGRAEARADLAERFARKRKRG